MEISALSVDAITLSIGRRRLLITLATLGALAYVVIAVSVDFGRLREALTALGFAGCALVLSLSLINYLFRFSRWHLYLARLGRRLPPWQHLLYYVSGFAFTVSPGKMGEAVRSVYLRHHGVTYAESIATLFVERLLDLLAVVLLASLIVIDHPRFRILVLGVLLVVLLALAIVSKRQLPDLLDAIRARVQGARLSRLLKGLATLMRTAATLLRLRLLLVGVVLGLMAWGAEGVGFYLICRGLHLSIDLARAVGIYSIAALAGSAAVFLPAGIGGMELVMTTLLVEQGVPARVALIATLLCRLATLWFAVLLGVAATTSVELYDHRHGLEPSHE
jgi:uncharacterized protein (TIRG00374 family)